MKTDLEKVFSLAGHPGLYNYVSQGKAGVIIESLLDKRRMSAGPSTRLTSLIDVAIFTDTEEVPLREVLLKIKEKENSGVAIDHKSPAAVLQKYFEEVLPNYDRERFYPSHMKKVLEWYNTLQKNDMLDFKEKEAEEQASE
jgi:ABC-type glycerol-3-phosphate transport system substrate-binding protein